MEEPLQCRPMNPGEETKVCNLVSRVFNDFVAPLYDQEGVQEFFKYVEPTLLWQRSQENHFVLVATIRDKVVGMIEIRDYNHVSLLFVDRQFQQRDISKELLRRALETCLQHEPKLAEVSVNSSPNAVQVYERLGFYQKKPEQIKNGIRFVPMVLELSRVEVGAA
jgi:predicted GNAT family N-acyltransferase